MNAYRIYDQLHPNDTKKCPYHGTDTKKCPYHGTVPFTCADRRLELALQLCRNTIDHVGASTRNSSMATTDDLRASMEVVEHEHVPIRIPNGKQLTCSMCRERAKAKGCTAKQKGGRCKASFMCKVCLSIFIGFQTLRDLPCPPLTKCLSGVPCRDARQP